MGSIGGSRHQRGPLSGHRQWGLQKEEGNRGGQRKKGGEGRRQKEKERGRKRGVEETRKVKKDRKREEGETMEERDEEWGTEEIEKEAERERHSSDLLRLDVVLMYDCLYI